MFDGDVSARSVKRVVETNVVKEVRRIETEVQAQNKEVMGVDNRDEEPIPGSILIEAISHCRTMLTNLFLAFVSDCLGFCNSNS